MSERFKKVYCGILDTSNNGYYACIDEAECETQRLVNLLNELSEENEQLRQALRFLMNYQRRMSNETTCEMGKEAKRMNNLDLYNSFLESRVRTLEEENEQLQKEHQEMLEKYLVLKLKIGEVLNDE